MAEAGWYPDPQDANSLQYFDGQRWTGDKRPAQVPVHPPQPQPQPQPQPAYQPTQLLSGLPAAPQPPMWQPPPTPPTRRNRKKLLLLSAGVVVVLVAAGLTSWLLLSGNDKPQLTYEGKQIAAPANVLTAAESDVARVVTRRHGARNGSTRCYFSQPAKVPSGQKKTDVGHNLLCGPVLFVDGDDSKPYLSVPVTSTKDGNKITLTPNASLESTDPEAVPETAKLVRPDGKSAPAGAGGLKAPQPPPAAKDVFLATPLGETSPPPTVKNARMVGKDESVTVEAAGVIARYGTGDVARTAPAGEQLLAFRISTDDGDIADSPTTAELSVSVDGHAGRSVPELSDPDDYLVIAVAKSSTVSLVLDDGGVKQTISLPGGKAGGGNIDVLLRSHRYALIAKTAPVPVHLSNSNGSANVTFHTTVTSASLDYWVPQHPTEHPSKTSGGLLSVDLDYTDPTSPGQTYGWDPQLLKLMVSGGSTVSARNIASKGHIFDVFQVPASFTKGTLEITGSEHVQGVTLTVSRTVKFAVSIKAG